MNNYLTHRLHKMLKATLVILVAFMASPYVHAQNIDCEDVTLACNSLVYISLDDDCEVTVLPDMILESPEFEDDAYTVTLRLDNQIIPNATLTSEHINQQIEVSIAVTECNASCWGYIIPEDKLAPVFYNCEDVEVKCYESTDPQDIQSPYAIDACEGDVAVSHTDAEESLMCEFDYSKIITRTWTASDSHGNTSTCTQIITVDRGSFDDVVAPKSYDGTVGNNPAFSCSDVFEKLANGAPTPEVTGRPISLACNTMNQYYEDQELPVCGVSRKYIRRWLVIDWCLGQEESYTQIIKILDDEKPVCLDNPEDVIIVENDTDECNNDFLVPEPNVQDCSNTSYTVAYKVDDGGSPYSGLSNQNVSVTNQGYIINNLPLGDNIVVYTITDDCGNVAKCYRKVRVIDTETPVAVCLEYVVVSINETGQAQVYVDAFNDGSYDNCGIDTIMVRRMVAGCGTNTQFSDKVTFCCNDATVDYRQVLMRVWDHSGNYNDCMINVRVEDKIAPTIQCPPSPVSVSCDQDRSPSKLGSATASDNCNVTVSHNDIEYLNDCGLGYIRRVWTATDVSGRTASCTQIIYVADQDPFDPATDIQWPTNIQLSSCTSGLSPEELNSKPVLSNTDCTNLGISHSDQIFEGIPGYCYKILRSWKIINWCAENAESNYYEYEQTIAISNNSAPIFEQGCQTVRVDANPKTCTAPIESIAMATDDCTPANKISYRYEIDLNKNGSIDLSGSSNTLQRELPVGIHNVYWYATDECNNENSCIQSITVEDNKAPTPICLGSITWVLDDEGKAEVWASDFDYGSTDACGNDEPLKFAFDSLGRYTSLSFTCADIPNGIYAEIPLRMYVIDAAGNFDFCEPILRLQDSYVSNACEDNNAGKPALDGMVRDYEHNGLPQMEVTLMNAKHGEHQIAMSSEEGRFDFELNYYDSYMLSASHDDIAKRGVNTRDLIKIQRHLLGKQRLNDPYQILAADVDNNKRLSPRDLLEIRKVILGIAPNFSSNKVWKFFDAKATITDSLRPFNLNSYIELSEVYSDTQEIEFIAVKNGDVDNTASQELRNEKSIESRSINYLTTNEINLVARNEYSIPFYASDMDELLGIQLELDFGKNVKVLGITSSQIKLSEDMYHTKGSSVALAWNDVETQNLNTNLPLFYVTVYSTTAGQLSDVLEISHKTIRPEAYASLDEASLLHLDIRDQNDLLNDTELHNAPNPFNHTTVITFSLPKAEQITLEVYDIEGALIAQSLHNGQRGSNTITFTADDALTSGVYHYTIKGKEFILHDRMIFVK